MTQEPTPENVKKTGSSEVKVLTVTVLVSDHGQKVYCIEFSIIRCLLCIGFAALPSKYLQVARSTVGTLGPLGGLGFAA